MSQFKLFDKQMFTSLSEQANSSPRKRANLNVHSDFTDSVQRLFISMEKSSYVKPHRHTQKNKWEFFYVVSGEMSFFLFDESGNVIEKIKLSADGDVKGLEIPPDTWHSTLVESPQACFFEVKNGPYEVVSDKDFASWAPNEGEDGVVDFMHCLRTCRVGDSMQEWRKQKD